MSFALMLPAGLAALAALVVPLAIHLVRRTEERPTTFAALRFIGARFPPRQRLRLSDLPLLALRLALIAALAVWLAQPAWYGVRGGAKPWVLVVPGVDPGAVDVPGERHWLAPGFPPFDAAPPRAGATASLLREADAMLDPATPIVVVAPATVDGLDGAIPRLRHEIRLVGATSVATRVATEVAPTTRIALRYDPRAADSVRYVRAAVAAWNAEHPGSYDLDVQTNDRPWPTATHWLFWLGAAPTRAVEAFAEHGGVAIVDTGATQRRGAGRVVALAAPLDPDAQPEVLDADFPHRLLDAIRDAPPPRRGALATVHAPDLVASAPPRALGNMLAMLIAALFVAERIVAWRRP